MPFEQAIGIDPIREVQVTRRLADENLHVFSGHYYAPCQACRPSVIGALLIRSQRVQREGVGRAQRADRRAVGDGDGGAGPLACGIQRREWGGGGVWGGGSGG